MVELSKLRKPVVLAIAGLDPSGGAGILADARTINAFGCYATAAITAITFQNSSVVHKSLPLDAETLLGQLWPVFAESRVDCIKTGMLPAEQIVREVARMVQKHGVRRLVVDPVMVSTSGYELMDEAALAELKRALLPLASVVTPNIPEAEKLVGFSIVDEDSMRRAAEGIRNLGAEAVLIKGGHLKDAQRGVIDLLNARGSVSIFRGEWIEGGGKIRGTGCTLASAIAAGLAKNEKLEDAVSHAREFVTSEIRRAT